MIVSHNGSEQLQHGKMSGIIRLKCGRSRGPGHLRRQWSRSVKTLISDSRPFLAVHAAASDYLRHLSTESQ